MAAFTFWLVIGQFPPEVLVVLWWILIISVFVGLISRIVYRHSISRQMESKEKTQQEFTYG